MSKKPRSVAVMPRTVSLSRHDYAMAVLARGSTRTIEFAVPRGVSVEVTFDYARKLLAVLQRPVTDAEGAEGEHEITVDLPVTIKISRSGAEDLVAKLKEWCEIAPTRPTRLTRRRSGVAP